MPSTIVREKVQQAMGILQETGIDAWLTFVSETSAMMDPVLPLIYGLDLTWASALLLTRSGERIIILGALEEAAARSTGAYATIIPYHQSIKPALLETLQRANPAQIAINYSTDNVAADGLTYGMYLLLQRYLQDTPFANRLISA